MRRLDPLWQRAAVLGSLWAGSEIVLGSFLHNLRFPLAGHVLTGIGVAILVAGHRRWPLPGLLVRAGLIAALMKSLSPSAVLLGPMVAIAMEGLLMEAAVRLLGGRTLGYLVGGALAMSWTLGHRIVTLVVTYGPDLVRLYADLVALAERQLGPIPLGPWGPLAVLALLNLAVGAGAALVGLRLGRDVLEREPGGRRERGLAVTGGPRHAAPGPGVSPSLPFLLLWAVALPSGLLGLATLSLGWKVVVVAVAVSVAVGRYRRVLRRLGRPGFWVTLLLLTTLAGAVVSALADGAGGGWLHGLALGAGMSLNAVFVTLGFAALSTELSHPLLRGWLERAGGGRLHHAVQAAFATLPAVVGALPGGREFVRSPLRTVGQLLGRTDEWLAALEEPPRIAGVISGERGSGKTTAAAVVVEALKAAGLRVGGFLAPGEVKDGQRWSIELVLLASGERIPMATRDPQCEWPALGPFKVSPAALAAGSAALAPEAAGAHDVLVVDEVGPWELGGDGWAGALDALHGGSTPLLLVVRRSLVADVLARFAPGSEAPVWDVAVTDAGEIAGAVLAELRR
ncbi:MAG TPA: nucleoside-triphosphatase [Longimicrobiales bacterium]|nr:nucleoside-triphosphatase [Longimicrobiales bacterium]